MTEDRGPWTGVRPPSSVFGPPALTSGGNMPINSLRISGSALSAQRARLDAISENIANAQTTRGPDGRAYRRKAVVFESAPASGAEAGGVRVRGVVQSTEPGERV